MTFTHGSELILIPITFGGVAFLCIAVIYRLILKESPGTPEMRRIARFIQDGAKAFLKREVKTIFYFIIALAVVLLLLLGWQVSLGFILGSLLSVLAMLIGMNVAIKANVRTTNAARTSAGKALQLAFRGGGAMGLAIISLNLLGISFLYLLFGASPENAEAIHLLVGFGFGASLAALFAQLGGGIYTKAADVGADLVGKLETKIPEDDPRNPAVIADLVGDNVGDCAGRGADLFESGSDNLVAAMILGLLFVGPPFFIGWKAVLFPLVSRALGNIATIIGVFSVRSSKTRNPITSLNVGLFSAGAFCLITYYMLATWMMNDIRYFYCLSIGIFAALAVSLVVQYYTGVHHKPVKMIANSAQSGAAVSLMTGVSYGMLSAAIPAIIIAISLVASYLIFGGEILGIFGIVIAALGLTNMKGIIMASDTFGPIVDNAGGIAQMSGVEKDVEQALDELDACGNITKAITKGFSMACALMTSVALLFAFVSEAFRIQTGALPLSISEVAPYLDLANPMIIVGVLIGATIPFLFSAMAILAVGKTSRQMVHEVRRQFEEIPGIIEGKAEPDYARCVDISTKTR